MVKHMPFLLLILLSTWTTGLSTARACPADFNGDGQLDTQDLMAFRYALRRQDPAADINGDGKNDLLDMLLFFDLYKQGCMGPHLNGEGWTVFHASGDTRKIYVSSSEGHDNNDGLTELTPVKTLEKGKSLMRHQYPDWLLIKKGDVFANPMGHWKKSGRSENEPMVITTYGQGARPLVLSGNQSGFKTQGGGGSPATINHLALVGIHFKADGFTGLGSPSAVSWLRPGENLLIEDCKMEGYKDGLRINGDNGRLVGFTLRRSVVVDSYSTEAHAQGIYTDKVDNILIEENLFDRNGWNPNVNGADPTIFNHNIYIQYTCGPTTLKNNIITRASSHGAQLRSAGLAQDNLFVQNPLGLSFGGGNEIKGIHLEGVSGSVLGNVIMEGTDIAENLPRGMGIDILNIGEDGCLVENNIIAHKTTTSNQTAINLDAKASGTIFGVVHVTVKNNTIYNWHGACVINKPGADKVSYGHQIINNVFQDHTPGSTGLLASTFSDATQTAFFENNSYYRASGGSPFEISDQLKTFTQWQNQVEPTATQEALTLVDPQRTVASYHQSLGKAATLEAFLAQARNQSKENYNTAYTAKEALAYLKAGYQKN